MSLDRVFGLSGQHAVITGGGSGLGLATAQCLVAAGASVTLVGTNEAKLAAACADLENSAYRVFDIVDLEGAEAFAGSLGNERGPASILVNNAGNTVKRPLRDMTPNDFRSVMDVHVGGAYALSRAFLPQLAQTEGSILFTASMSSFLGIPNVIGYAAAKSAYVGMVRSLSTELAPEGIRVNGVAPGWIETDLFRQATQSDPARKQKIQSRIPSQRFGKPEDIGWAMVYLASPAAAYISGHILVVDGGALHAF